jgi:hypothetical protein
MFFSSPGSVKALGEEISALPAFQLAIACTKLAPGDAPLKHAAAGVHVVFSYSGNNENDNVSRFKPFAHYLGGAMVPAGVTDAQLYEQACKDLTPAFRSGLEYMVKARVASGEQEISIAAANDVDWACECSAQP